MSDPKEPSGSPVTPDHLPQTERTRLRRNHKRGHFDRQTIYEILDACPLCHLGYLLDGAPAVTPTLQWRDGDHVYWHASSASRALRSSNAAQVCLTVTLLDALVLARSAFHHSANYRAVMIFGEAHLLEDEKEKTIQLERFVDGLYPNRWQTLRPMTDKELKATGILRLPIEEASAKIRDTGVADDEEDYDWPVWSGLLPVRYEIGEPEADPRNVPGVEWPATLGDVKIG
ncbi:MAG: pyridoxamine 5'-phosphate oxidase family protein [Pseudomonadota bacterium]